MGHHSPRHADDEINQALLEKLEAAGVQQEAAAQLRMINEALQADPERDALGSTNRFPDGQLTPSDEGEIAYRVGAKAGQVVIDFGQPTAWIGLDPEAADDMARALEKWARKARAQEVSGAA